MKVAEGEYRVRGGEAGHLSKNALDHRILYTREQGYRESAEPGLRPRRYSCSNSIKCWIATSPYLLKMEHEEGAVIELKIQGVRETGP